MSKQLRLDFPDIVIGTLSNRFFFLSSMLPSISVRFMCCYLDLIDIVVYMVRCAPHATRKSIWLKRYVYLMKPIPSTSGYFLLKYHHLLFISYGSHEAHGIKLCRKRCQERTS